MKNDHYIVILSKIEEYEFKTFTNAMKQVGWPNGKALDYESRDCRFDPCVDQHDELEKSCLHFAFLA